MLRQLPAVCPDASDAPLVGERQRLEEPRVHGRGELQPAAALHGVACVVSLLGDMNFPPPLARQGPLECNP
eukprot:12658451-Alexandrium_andersonii.AAC.1